MTQNGTGKTGASASVVTHRHSIALPEGAEVLTLDGALPVEYLGAGDRIITRAGARRLAGIHVTVLRPADVLRVGAGTLAHDRPADALHLLPDQPVLLRDWRARALCGAREALVPLHRLADGEYIRAERLAELRLFHLEFAEHVILYAGGMELGSRAGRVVAA